MKVILHTKALNFLFSSFFKMHIKLEVSFELNKVHSSVQSVSLVSRNEKSSSLNLVATVSEIKLELNYSIR